MTPLSDDDVLAGHYVIGTHVVRLDWNPTKVEAYIFLRESGWSLLFTQVVRRGETDYLPAFKGAVTHLVHAIFG